jgi:hypothetical protein
MGDVYRARDTRLGRNVAVKVISTDAGPVPDRLPRFEREAQAVAALNHPNILALHDIGQESDIVYAVMELLEGETLRSRLETGRLTPAKAIDYAIQIAQGLAAAHERGIIHRDLKPENLFITRDGRVKILDFGLAQQTAAASSGPYDSQSTTFSTGAGIVLGTPGYMSPEQVLGQGATARSDLFAFGVIVYEMLAGSHPFLRGTPAETMTAIVREDPPPLERAAPGLPAGLTRIIERCLDKHASDRPADARDLALFLGAVGTSGYPSTATATIVTTEAQRVRGRVLAISCGLLILLSATTWAFVHVMADRAVTAAIDDDLGRAERLVRRVERDRLGALSLTARLVASFPELKALFATDAATVHDYLVFYRQRNPDTPLLLALGPDGSVVARADETSAEDNTDWFDALSGRRGEPATLHVRGRPYHTATAPAEAGGNIFGHIVAALSVDDAFAAALREATQDEIVLLSGAAVVASTLRGGQTPWRSREEWRRAGGGPDRTTDVTVGAQQFAAREVVLGDQPALSVVVLKSRDEAIEPFRRIENGVIVIGLLCAVVAAAGSFWIARTLTSALSRRG